MKVQILALVSSFIAGGGLVKLLVYVSKALPPLKSDAGWWRQLFYNLIKNTSGLDPSAMIINPQPKQ